MQITSNHAGGISVIAFIVAVIVSMAYYQFTYLPEVNSKPVVSEEIKKKDGNFLPVPCCQYPSLQTFRVLLFGISPF